MCERTEQLLSPYHFSFSFSLFSSLLSLSRYFSVAQVFTSYIFNNYFLAYSSSPMDNNPLTPRASSFSIASLITSDCCDDENSLYHSLSSPIGSNHQHQHLNLLNLPSHSSFEKIPNEFYPNSIQTDLQQFRSATLTETNNGQYQQQITSSSISSSAPGTIKENRSANHKNHHQVTNLQKSLTTIRNMEGTLLCSGRNNFFDHLLFRLYSISHGKNQINIE